MRERGFEIDSVPVLETPRLVLRPLVEEDKEAYFRVCSDEGMMMSYGLPVHQRPEDSLATIRTLARWFEGGRSVRWGISPIEDRDTLIGDIGYWQFDLIRDRGELGAKILPARGGKGLGREAMEAVIDYGFDHLDLRGVDANIAPSNTPSLRLAARLGFVTVGIRPGLGYSLLEQRSTDMVFLSLGRDERRALRDGAEAG